MQAAALFGIVFHAPGTRTEHKVLPWGWVTEANPGQLSNEDGVRLWVAACRLSICSKITTGNFLRSGNASFDALRYLRYAQFWVRFGPKSELRVVRPCRLDERPRF